MYNLSKRIDAYHQTKNHNQIEKVIFENSIDCLYYGYGFEYVNICNCDKAKAKVIFNQAKSFLANN